MVFHTLSLSGIKIVQIFLPVMQLRNGLLKPFKSKQIRGGLPYMGYIGMCGPKGYGFSAVLVINRVSIIAILPPLWS